MRITNREDQAGKTLYDEYAKVEEVDRWDTRWVFPARSFAIPPEVEGWRYEGTVEAENIWNESSERRPASLTEEASVLEVENDEFQATAHLRHENVVENRI